MTTRRQLGRKYGITPIDQRPDGCLNAVITMLTGIDNEILPMVTVDVTPSKRWHRFIGKFFTSYSQLGVPQYDWNSPNGVAVRGCNENEYGAVFLTTLRELRRLYRINYGIALRFCKKQPKKPAGRMVLDGNHIVVHLPDGNYIGTKDTDIGYKYRSDNLNIWVTARFIP